MKKLWLKMSKSRYIDPSERVSWITWAVLLVAVVTTSSLIVVAQESSDAPAGGRDELQVICKEMYQPIIDGQSKILDEISKIQADLRNRTDKASADLKDQIERVRSGLKDQIEQLQADVKNIKNIVGNKSTKGIETYTLGWFSYFINVIIIISFVLLLLLFIRTLQSTNRVDYTLRSLNKIDERIDRVLSHYRRSE